MSITQTLDKKDFDPFVDLINIPGLMDDEISDPDQILRQLNNLEFKLQLHGQTCLDGLECTTKSIVSSFHENSLS